MMTLEQYLEKISRFTNNDYGQMVRRQFADNKGTAELGMLASPSADELGQLEKAVAIMTPAEKQLAESLSDEQIQKIAADAQIDAGIFAIFINGYCLERKKADL